MDDADKMLYLKGIVGGDDSDFTLLSYLYQAKDAILNRMYPYLLDTQFEGLDVPDKYAWKQIRIAAYLMNKRGAEGEMSHSENGISRSYGSEDIPSSLLADVLPMIDVPR